MVNLQTFQFRDGSIKRGLEPFYNKMVEQGLTKQYQNLLIAEGIAIQGASLFVLTGTKSSEVIAMTEAKY